jgi:hypothetical protein
MRRKSFSPLHSHFQLVVLSANTCALKPDCCVLCERLTVRLIVYDNINFHFSVSYRFDATQSREKMMKGVRRGCVRLKGAVIGIDDQDVNTFTITVDHKTFHFQVSKK